MIQNIIKKLEDGCQKITFDGNANFYYVTPSEFTQLIAAIHNNTRLTSISFLEDCRFGALKFEYFSVLIDALLTKNLINKATFGFNDNVYVHIEEESEDQEENKSEENGQLTQVNAWGEQHWKKFADYLAIAPLNTLALPDNDFGKMSSEHLKTLISEGICLNTSITALDLAGNNLGIFDKKEIKLLTDGLTKMTQLVSISLQGKHHESPNEGEDHIGLLPTLSFKQLFDAFNSHPSLLRFNFFGMHLNELTDENYNIFIDFLTNKKIVSLGLNYTNIGALSQIKLTRLFEALKSNSAIKQLSIGENGCERSPEQMSFLLHTICHMKLTDLTLDHFPLPVLFRRGVDYRHELSLFTHPTIEKLNLSDCALGQMAPEILQDLLMQLHRNSKITLLNLAANGFNGNLDLLIQVVDLALMPRLQLLYLSPISNLPYSVMINNQELESEHKATKFQAKIFNKLKKNIAENSSLKKITFDWQDPQNETALNNLLATERSSTANLTEVTENPPVPVDWVQPKSTVLAELEKALAKFSSPTELPSRPKAAKKCKALKDPLGELHHLLKRDLLERNITEEEVTGILDVLLLDLKKCHAKFRLKEQNIICAPEAHPLFKPFEQFGTKSIEIPYTKLVEHLAFHVTKNKDPVTHQQIMQLLVKSTVNWKQVMKHSRDLEKEACRVREKEALNSKFILIPSKFNLELNRTHYQSIYQKLNSSKVTILAEFAKIDADWQLHYQKKAEEKFASLEMNYAKATLLEMHQFSFISDKLKGKFSHYLECNNLIKARNAVKKLETMVADLASCKSNITAIENSLVELKEHAVTAKQSLVNKEAREKRKLKRGQSIETSSSNQQKELDQENEAIRITQEAQERQQQIEERSIRLQAHIKKSKRPISTPNVDMPKKSQAPSKVRTIVCKAPARTLNLLTNIDARLEKKEYLDKVEKILNDIDLNPALPDNVNCNILLNNLIKIFKQGSNDKRVLIPSIIREHCLRVFYQLAGELNAEGQSSPPVNELLRGLIVLLIDYAQESINKKVIAFPYYKKSDSFGNYFQALKQAFLQRLSSYESKAEYAGSLQFLKNVLEEPLRNKGSRPSIRKIKSQLSSCEADLISQNQLLANDASTFNSINSAREFTQQRLTFWANEMQHHYPAEYQKSELKSLLNHFTEEPYSESVVSENHPSASSNSNWQPRFFASNSSRPQVHYECKNADERFEEKGEEKGALYNYGE
jgi:hypothetical protein